MIRLHGIVPIVLTFICCLRCLIFRGTIFIGVIANAINSGTSFMQKQPFVRKGANKGAPKAIEAMKEFIENELNAINK